jgi:hypothetical protein
MSRWTATRLAEHTTSLLRDAQLIVVSNRAPYSHRWHRPAPLELRADTPLAPGPTIWDCGWLRRLLAQVSRVLQGNHALRWSQPAGGLTSALDPVMQACHGTWVAWGSGSADRQAVDAQDHVQVPPHNPQYTLRCVWLSEAQVDGFYSGFANSALWPLCHLSLERTVFTPLHWCHDQDVNAYFATVVAEECGGSALLSGSRITTWRSARPCSASVSLTSRSCTSGMSPGHPGSCTGPVPGGGNCWRACWETTSSGSTSRSTVTISSSVRSECWAPASTTKPVWWSTRGATRGYDHSPLALTMPGGRIWPVDVAWHARLCACARSLTWRFLFSQEFMRHIPQWVKRGLIIKYLPPYSPELNLIEILWRCIKYHWLPFSAYMSFSCLVQAVEDILTRFGTDYTINFQAT